MSVTSVLYSVYERLASAKMNAMVSQINAHTHDGTYGPQIQFSYISGQILAYQIPAGSITGTMIAPNTITNINIAPGTITTNQIDITSLHLVNGYAVYAP